MAALKLNAFSERRKFFGGFQKMNKKIKCAMSLAAVAALSVCVLTGCTGDKDKDPADSQTPDVSQSA